MNSTYKHTKQMTSRAVKVTPSTQYNPPRKAMSLRDQRRANVAARRAAGTLEHIK